MIDTKKSLKHTTTGSQGTTGFINSTPGMNKRNIARGLQAPKKIKSTITASGKAGEEAKYEKKGM